MTRMTRTPSASSAKSAALPLKDVLQCDLHRALQTGERDFGSSSDIQEAPAESRTVEIEYRLRGIEMVRQVEYFGPELQCLALTRSEFPGEGHVDVDRSRTYDIPSCHRAIRTRGRPFERCRVEPLVDGLFRCVRRGKYLVRSPVVGSR